jgi:membrane peptidoglycan carboxypeptidase
MTSMLTGVVSDGTGACAAIPGYLVAGKTGTSRKAVDGGYSRGTMASFIGFAPALHPRLAAIVVLDEPTSQYGGAAAAPVFSSVMQFALSRSHVAPDDVGNTQFNASRATAATTGTNCDPPATALAALRRTTVTTTTVTTTTATTTPGPAQVTTASTPPKKQVPAGSKATPTSLGHDTSQSG